MVTALPKTFISDVSTSCCSVFQYDLRAHCHVNLPLSIVRFNYSPPASGLELAQRIRRNRIPGTICKLSMLPQNPIVSDICVTGFSGALSLAILRLCEETARRGIFDQTMNRKVLHVAIGLAFMACWPLFSSGFQGAFLASLIPGVQIIRMLLIGSGLWKNEDVIKSMTRYGDHRELLTGPLYYCIAITFACIKYWRSSPIAIAVICNLCAGDGFADIVGRRFGRKKLFYNREKSLAGSAAMVVCGFAASIAYMVYFASFGYLQASWKLAMEFLMLSLACAVVESLPVSTKFDDNLTVPLTAIALGNLLF